MVFRESSSILMLFLSQTRKFCQLRTGCCTKVQRSDEVAGSERKREKIRRVEVLWWLGWGRAGGAFWWLAAKGKSGGSPCFLPPPRRAATFGTPARFVPPAVHSKRSMLVGKGNFRLGDATARKHNGAAARQVLDPCKFECGELGLNEGKRGFSAISPSVQRLFSSGCGVKSCPAEKTQEGYAEDICRGAKYAVTFGNFNRVRDYKQRDAWNVHDAMW
jgi:hypothetical protein